MTRAGCLGTLLSAILVLSLVEAAAAQALGELTLKRVLLSSGGVGYFEYQATVEGDREVTLDVPLDQVDDVLKSLVVSDDKGGGGQVRLPGREPLAQAFRDLPFGPEALSSPAKLLNALQGARITARGARQIEGRVLNVVPETRLLGDGLGTVTRHRVSVLAAGGITQFILEEAEAVDFAGPEVRRQIEVALASVAAHRRRNSRRLTILARGEGRRRLTVGYVVAVPLWKASYRVTLPPRQTGGPARLQGWALIDNMSGRDWTGVELTLASGNPVTFRQALYTAYFVDRPEVPVEVLGRVLPKVDTGVIAGARVESEAPPKRRASNQGNPQALTESAVSAAPAEGRRFEAAQSGAMGAAADELRAAEPTDQGTRAILAVASEEAATQVLFRLAAPVSVAKGHSLMVPIIDRATPAERLALYQPSSHALHPLASLRLANDGESGLPPGVLTLYERSPEGAVSFVGDARLSVLPAGDERLISYALDQKTRADREVKASQRIAKGKISRGVLELTVVDEETTSYRLKAPAEEARDLVIEHPRRPGWELKSPAPEAAEVTETSYRLRQRLEAGEAAEVAVTLQRPRTQRLQLLRLPTAQLAAYVRTGELDAPLRRAFERIAELRRGIEGQERRVARLTEARERIFQEQKRIRDNLSRVPQNSDLQRRYLTKLDGQESELEGLLTSLQAAQGDRDRAQEALADYVSGLTL